MPTQSAMIIGCQIAASVATITLRSTGSIANGSTSVSPSFGSSTLAGSLLIGLVTSDTNSTTSCSDGAWTKQIQENGAIGAGSVSIFFLANASSGYTAPSFNTPSGVYSSAVLLEVTGAASSPSVISAGGTHHAGGTIGITATASSSDSVSGTFVVQAGVFINSSTLTYTSEVFNNGSVSLIGRVNNNGNANAKSDYNWSITTTNASANSWTTNVTNLVSDGSIAIASFT